MEKRKIRHSHQRDMIYNYLISTHRHPSAEMIYEELKSKIPNLSLGTVYRNLNLLEQMGKVKKITTLNNVERYDAFCEEHVHFICEECGRIIDLPLLTNEIKQLYSKDKENEVTSVSLILGGTCASCKNKK